MALTDLISRCKIEPRPYQERIVTKAVDMFVGRHIDKDNKQHQYGSVMIESPTGSGKTTMALLTLKALQEELGDLVVCWTAMRRNLLSQAAKENKEKEIDVRDIHFVSMFEKSPDKLLAARKGRKMVLVIDEAQHDAASSMTHLHNITQPDYILGMTATPFRTDKMKLCFDRVIKDAGIHQLIGDGYLSKFDHYTIEQWTPEAVATHYCADPKKWGKSIFYFLNHVDCAAIHRIFQDRGVRSEVVTGDSDCEKQIAMFRDGSVDCLINCMKLTEGFDEPSLQTAWVRDSVRGPTVQMAGRAFRKHPDVPRKQVVQSKGTSWPITRTAMPVGQFVWQDDQWLSLTLNPHIRSAHKKAMTAITQADVKMPEFIANRVNKKRRRLGDR